MAHEDAGESLEQPPSPRDVAGQIVESLSSGVIAVNPDGAVIASNAAATTYLRLRPGDLGPGVRLHDLNVAQPFVAVFEEVKATGRPVNRRELFISHPDGTKTEVGLGASLLKGPASFNGVIFLFTDMTERRQLERAAELNRQLATLGELTAGVVHELRTPVMVISGMTELIKRRTMPDGDTSRNIELIMQECRNIEGLISQFLGFARPFELKEGWCSPEEVAQRAVKLSNVKAHQKNVRLVRDIAGDLPAFWADSGKMVQVLVNLLNNAVEVVEEQSGKVTLRGSTDGDDLVFVVSDNGPGLKLAPGEDLFEPFVTKKEGGTGLGLSIVSRIVHAHHGSIACDDGDEGGAVFTVRIPVRKEE